MHYQSQDGHVYETMSLEYIKLSKKDAHRPKDIIDIAAIEKLNLIRNEVYSRILPPVTIYEKYIN